MKRRHLGCRCYTLQTQTLKKATRRTSLKVTINVNVAGYLSHVESAGISFFVHEPGNEPDMMLNRYEAATGFTTSAGIRMYEYDYLPEPYKAFGDSTCTDTESEEFLSQGDSSLFYGSDNQTRYSLDCCLTTRARVKAEGICNCSVGKTGDCGIYRIKGCLKNTMADILDEALASDLLGCPRPCHSHDYMVTMSTSYFPSAAALFHLKRNDRVRGNISHIRANYLQLQIYFVDLIVRKTEHVAKYEWTTVMGLLGGNMGFFLGASVLTLAELLDFIVCLLLLCCEKLCRPRVLTRRTSSVQGFQAPLPPKGAL
ncbi:acid-sensing ion channel 3-like [Littorina saxatilis]|uniref:acid-sensing ion channel 3-like n=1 Tax=Littorina saxatilis TaxID=31220 RepID=UPI0038B57318